MTRSILTYILLCLYLSCLVFATKARATDNIEQAEVSAPSTIRVFFVRTVDNAPDTPLLDSNGEYVPSGISPNPIDIPFETDYLPSVVGSEMPDWLTTQVEPIQAQAVAARSYALYKMNRPRTNPYINGTYDVTQTIYDQYYNPARATTLTRQAVNNTSRNYLIYPNISTIDPIISEFSANHRETNFTSAGGAPYLKSIYDPITPVHSDKGGHGRGLAQVRAAQWTTGQDKFGVSYPKWSYTKILAHYYSGIQMRHGETGNLYWGPLRWNMVETNLINKKFWVNKTASHIKVTIQNTGEHTWSIGTKYLCLWWQRRTTGGSVTTTPIGLQCYDCSWS